MGQGSSASNADDFASAKAALAIFTEDDFSSFVSKILPDANEMQIEAWKKVAQLCQTLVSKQVVEEQTKATTQVELKGDADVDEFASAAAAYSDKESSSALESTKMDEKHGKKY